MSQITRILDHGPGVKVKASSPAMATLRGATLVLALALALASAQIADNDRVDCHPDENASQASCQARGCLWDSSEPTGTAMPWCYYPQDFGYQ